MVSKQGYRLFSLSSVDRVDEIFGTHDEDTKIAERLFSSSLVAVVTASEPHKLKVRRNSKLLPKEDFHRFVFPLPPLKGVSLQEAAGDLQLQLPVGYPVGETEPFAAGRLPSGQYLYS